MDGEKILELAVEGSSILSSVRKINRTMNTCRVLSYIALGVIVMLNIFGVINTIKQ